VEDWHFSWHRLRGSDHSLQRSAAGGTDDALSVGVVTDVQVCPGILSRMIERTTQVTQAEINSNHDSASQMHQSSHGPEDVPHGILAGPGTID